MMARDVCGPIWWSNRPSQTSRMPRAVVKWNLGEMSVPGIDLAYRAMKRITVAALLAALALPLSARAETPALSCDTPLDLIRLANPLSHVAQKLAGGAPITIVAIGSSSAAGAGASSPAANYPSRLAVELKRLFPTHSITVLNSGVGGEGIR